jgi:hypothetical protein
VKHDGERTADRALERRGGNALAGRKVKARSRTPWARPASAAGGSGRAEAGFAAVRVGAIHEPAWLGSDVDDVMAYALATTQVRDLLAAVPDPALVDRILATMASQFAARQNGDGVWGEAAAYVIKGFRGAG